jgi:hypothetical protein
MGAEREQQRADEPVLRPLNVPSSEYDGVASVTAERFRKSFGEDIRHALDLTTWRSGGDLAQEYDRIEREVRESVERETDLQKEIRRRVFAALKNRPVRNAGYHEADRAIIKKIHSELLFNGGMEACDGAIQVHDTLPLTIFQIGVTLVSYSGDQGSWSQRLFRRDLKQAGPSVDAVLDMLERRSQRDATSGDDGAGELVRKALLDYAERAILLHHGTAPWLMGHGNPITYELLTGGANLELMVAGTKVVRELVESRPQFVFVANEPGDRMLLTIGQALKPMEYAIVGTLDERLEHWLHQKRFRSQLGSVKWDSEEIPATEWIPRVIERVASKIAVGLFRATPVSPAQVFYAHVNHADLAAHMVLADSVLQENHGSPMLIDMARHICSAVFGQTLGGLAENAYAAAGVPWRYAKSLTTR